MSAGPAVFTLVAAVLIAALPRRTALLPLLVAVLYTTRAPVLELGPANLSVLRVLILVGMVRVIARGESLANGANSVDGFLVAWATILVGSSLFHTSDAWTFRLGMILGELGFYGLCRVFLQDADDVRRLFRFLCLILWPLAVLMLMEKATAHTYFAFMGAADDVTMRNGHARASGPFVHSILAGTVGASCVPMALYLWRQYRKTALLGLCSAAMIVFASTSSGPIVMLGAICLALLIWNVRARLRAIRWAAVAAILGLQLVMKDPVYFLIARIDLTGGSTGWFRAQLIRSASQHFSEWWAAGTDYTRHWMASGISANSNHTDMTNHYLAAGVMGGLPVLILFVLVIWRAFVAVGRALGENESMNPERAFLIWTLGAMLFGQVVNFWSISLFDQSVSFYYLILASIGAVQSAIPTVASQPVRASARVRPDRLAVSGLGGRTVRRWTATAVVAGQRPPRSRWRRT